MSQRLAFTVAAMLIAASACDSSQTGFPCFNTEDCVEQDNSCPSGQVLFCNGAEGTITGICDCEQGMGTGGTGGSGMPSVVLEQPRNDDWDYFSDAGCDPEQTGCPNVVAENFLVQSGGASITEITVWGGWWPNDNRTSDDWTVIIHSDAGGLPGPAVYTQANFTASSIQDIGEIFGVGYFEITLALTGEVNLSAGTHWLEIFHDSGAGDYWFWVTGDMDPVNGLPGFAEAPEAPGVTWALHDVASEPPLRRSLAVRIN